MAHRKGVGYYISPDPTPKEIFTVVVDWPRSWTNPHVVYDGPNFHLAKETFDSEIRDGATKAVIERVTRVRDDHFFAARPFREWDRRVIDRYPAGRPIEPRERE